MRASSRLAALACAHGVSDAAAGYLIGQWAFSLPPLQASLAALLYNALAFGLQPFVGWWADRWRRSERLVAAALAASSLGCALSGSPLLSAYCLGLGSCGLHAAAGGLALRATPGRAVGPGWFTAPGVLGLAAGGWLAARGIGIAAGWATPLLILAVWMLFLPESGLPQADNGHSVDQPRISFRVWEAGLFFLLAAYALRSMIWTSIQAVWHEQIDLLLWLAVAAALGKVLGGIFADWVGWKRWGFFALGLAALLLAVGPANSLPFAGGVLLLQSSVPVMLAASGQLLPGRPATAAGLALGTATLLGGLPALLGMSSNCMAPVGVIVTLAASLAAWGWASRQ